MSVAAAARTNIARQSRGTQVLQAHIRFIVVILCMGFMGSARAQSDAKEATVGLPVVDVRVEGLRRVGREAALSGLITGTGSALDPDALTQDIHTLWRKGFFTDIRVEKEELAKGWRVVFVVVEKPSVKEVKFSGRDDVSEDDLKGVVDVKPYTILNAEQLKSNVEKIKDLYVGKGFYLADVKYHLEEDPKSPFDVTVVFDIVENAKVVVRQISFSGNQRITAAELKGVMQTREGNELSALTQAGTYKEEFFQTDMLRLQALYYDRGFVTVRIGEPTVNISPDRRFIYVSIPITEGEQYSIGTITFNGDIDLKKTDGTVAVDEAVLRSKLTVAPGQIFNRTTLFEDIQQLTDIYRDEGYAFANVTPNSEVNKEDRIVNLDMVVERGELVYIGRIEMSGNTRTRDKVLRREMRIVEGDRFSGSLLNESRARIFQLGFFETVNVVTKQGERPDVLDVVVEVKEKSTGTFQIGAGFSSVEKFIATAQISQNNFLGNGQLLSLSAQLSFGAFARQLATLQFFEPYFLDTLWSFGFNAYITQRFYRDFQRNATGVSPSFGYLLTPDLRLSAGYTLEKIEISTPVGATGADLHSLAIGGRNSALNASISYDTRDNRLFPSRGQYHVLSTEISDRGLGSDQGLEYRRVQAFARFYHPIFWQLVFRLNAQLGMVFGRGSNPVPISERFFPGGIFSVRGFQPRGLGPTIPVVSKGDPLSPTSRFAIGGNKEAVFNLEVEFPLIQAAGIKGVVFADAGNAYDDDENFFYLGGAKAPKAYLMRSNRMVTPPLGLYYSFGFGFRWFSPIGPLRFEWGIPITKREITDRSMIFEFTIGNFF